MNKRATPRFTITLDVAVTFPGDEFRACRVRDYCAGGMYLMCSGTGPESIPAKRGDPLLIEFSNPLNPRGPRYQLDGVVARVVGNGLGLAFTGQNPVALAALSKAAMFQKARGQAMHDREKTVEPVLEQNNDGTKIKQTIAECRKRADMHLRRIMHAFLTRANDMLFSSASEAKSNTLQSAYFGAMNELRKGQGRFTQSFLSRLDEQFETLTRRDFQSPFSQKAGEQGELSLVDSDELDKWLMVRAMAAKLEGGMADTLEALEARFEAISVSPLSLENNPVGPFVIASVFRESVSDLVLENEAASVLFSAMESLLFEKLPGLYDELNDALIARGVLPSVEKKLQVVKQDSGPSSTPLASHEEARQWRVPEVETSVAPSAVTEQNHPLTAVRPVTGASPRVTTSHPNPPPTPPVAEQSPLPTAQPSKSIRYIRPSAQASAPVESSSALSTYRGIKELMRLQHAASGDTGGEGSNEAGFYSGEEVLQALTHLEQTVAQINRETVDTLEHVHYLAESLGEMSEVKGKVLNEADKEKVGYVGGLFSSILQDNLVPRPSKPWFSMLEVPLLKAGLLDNSLVEDSAHPARLVLNRLETIGDLLQGDETPKANDIRQRVEAIIGRVRDNVERDEQVFIRALDELDRIEQEASGSYEENVAALIAELDKETKLNSARQAILEGLNHRLGQREVPLIVLELLDMGWKNLLLRTYLNSGPDSSIYKTYLNVIDKLYARLMETMTYSRSAGMSDETLQEWLERMLSIISSDQTKNAHLLERIKAHLAGNSDTALETRFVPALVSKVLNRTHHIDKNKPEDVEENIWSLFLLDAQELELGERFLFCNADEVKYQATLIWRDKECSRFVFVDNAGRKRLDLMLGEVANNLYRKILSRLDEKSLSVTERATYHFLQSMHNKLAHQAQHDELTGLLNRKAFEKELEEAFLSARSGKARHLLAYIDLDRFNIINTTCGHAEGDKLLGNATRVLQETLSGEAVLSRLGGDEFGILLKNCTQQDGMVQLTAVHDAIRGMRFVCENNEFKVTASIGVAEVNEASDSSGRLLSAVDAAAFTAKEMGRDNIQVHQLENERITSRRNMLDWVGRINVLFDKNLIRLRCQKIKPVHGTINSLPYYEVLLDVMDEEGNKVPLDEFIVAAERYNRIIDIDTWVVDYVANWMEERREKLDRISAIAINLSGSSLSNARFMEHIGNILRRPGFPASKVCFEVTETIAINNLDNASRFMRKLKETGCQFSLDDFGTGSSSYSYLKSLPVDFLKIDGAFVKDIATNTHDYAVVKSINEIGHAMGKKTVAEYVETEFAYEALKQIGLDYVQGFLVEKPVPLFKLFG